MSAPVEKEWENVSVLVSEFDILSMQSIGI